MKVEIKIYKTFDPDLYALSAYGIQVSYLMKEALKHYVRGEYIHFHIPRSLTYDFKKKRRYIHLAMTFTDPESIDFLKTKIEPRQRTAFLKSLIRGSFTTPQLGVFFRNSDTNKADTRMIKLADVEDLSNYTPLEVSQKTRRDYTIIPKDDKKNQDKKEIISNQDQEQDQQQEQVTNHNKKKKRKKKNKNNHQNQQVPSNAIQESKSVDKPNDNSYIPQSTDNKASEDIKPDEKKEGKLENKFGIKVNNESSQHQVEKPKNDNDEILMVDEDDDEDNLFNAFNNLANS